MADVRRARELLKKGRESPYALPGEPGTREEARRVCASIDKHVELAVRKRAGTEKLRATQKRLRQKWDLLPGL